MNLLVSLDVALGLVVVYLTFSLALTALNEGVAAALSSRAKWLRRGIAALLTPAGDDPHKTSTTEFYASPFVRYLGEGGWGKGGRPSYLPSWTVLQGLLNGVSAAKVEVFDDLAKIKAAIEKLPANSPVRVALLDLCARAGTDLEAFRRLLDEWFDGFEKQVMAWYRQKTQFVLMAMSVAVAAAMNVDTVAIARQLSTDPKVREAAVAVALKQAQVAPPALGASAPDAANAREHIDELAGTGLAIGWNDTEWRHTLSGVGNALAKIGGLMLSALAFSLGAPFWFDALKKLASVRSVGLSTTEHEAKEAQQKARTG